MDIIDTLKEKNISKSRFAVDFGLSRPTLDDYIKRYQNGETLPKDKYQTIFDALFSEPLSKEGFDKRYKSFKLLLRRDRALKLDDLSADNTDSIIQIVTVLKENVEEGGDNQKLLSFINFLCLNYGRNDIVDIWVKYYAHLNCLVDDIVFTEKEKRYIGCLYHINHALGEDNGELDKIDPSFYDEYLAKRNLVMAKKDDRTAFVKDQFSKMIEKYVAEIVSNSNEEESKEDVLKKVLTKITINQG